MKTFTKICSICGETWPRDSYRLTSSGSRRADCRECENKRSVEYSKKFPFHSVWRGMNDRCYNKNNSRYSDYGGRGITVCDEWRNSYFEFEKFYKNLEHCYDEGYSLDRIDNNGPYSPTNCRLATATEQRANQRLASNSVDIRSGFKHVSWDKSCRQWKVKVHHKGSRYHIGNYVSLDKAVEERNTAYKRLGIPYEV